MQLLWEKQNSIHLHLSPEYFVCYAKAGDRNERSCYWILILRKCGQFMGLAHTVRWLGEGLMLSVRATAMTPKRVQFRHIRTLAWSFFMFILKNDSCLCPEWFEEPPKSQRRHFHWPWQLLTTPYSGWLWGNADSYRGLSSVQYLGLSVTMLALLKSNSLSNYFAIVQQRKRSFVWAVPHGKDRWSVCTMRRHIYG